MLSCILACAVGLASSQTFGPEPSRLERGEAALARGELGVAAEEFTTHYLTLTPEQRASSVGEYVVMYAADVYDQAFAKDGVVEHLEQSRELLVTFVRDVEKVHGSEKPELTKAARAKIEALDEQIAAERPAEPTKQAEPIPPPAKEAAVPQPGPETIEPDRPTPPVDRSGPDRIGIALVATGATLTVGGIAMLAAGLAGATERRAEAMVDERCEADGATPQECALEKTDDYRPYLDGAAQSDRRVAFGSIAPLVVGAALIVGGAVRLARRGKHRARVDVGGWVLQGRGGAVVSGRF